MIRGSLAVGLILSLCGVSTPEARILRRHDTSDTLYIEAARSLPRPIVLARAPRGASDGMGAFVAPRWILTAAHVARHLSAGQALPDDPGLTVVRVAAHPSSSGEVDLALVEVSGPHAYSVTPACADGDVVGARLQLVGAGDHGTGETGPTGVDRNLRAAENLIDTVSATTLQFDFDAPADALEREGVSGPGDSGGPAYLQVGASTYCLAGISSGQMSEPGRRGRYGAVEIYARVSTAQDWIRTTLS